MQSVYGLATWLSADLNLADMDYPQMQMCDIRPHTSVAYVPLTPGGAAGHMYWRHAWWRHFGILMHGWATKHIFGKLYVV